MEITFLGTTAMVPTKERNHTSLYVDVGRQALLFDCGENTQRQITHANLRHQKITHIFISHWHGDHVLGLPGLLQTLAAQDYKEELHIYGPPSTSERIKGMFTVFDFDNDIALNVHDIHPEQDSAEGEERPIAQVGDLLLYAYALDHSLPTLGYALKENDRRKVDKEKAQKIGLPGPLIGKLQEGKTVEFEGKEFIPDDISELIPGKKVSFVFDTTLSTHILALAQDSDVLICESTYLHELEEKAAQYKHLTARQAAEIASQANAKKLVLTHFSPRYKQTGALLQEAKMVFPNTVAAHDFMKITI